MNNMDELSIQLLTEKLQKVMRLQDWDINTRLLTADDIEDDCEDADVYGYVEIETHAKAAHIVLNVDEEHDWYFTLVHELHHVLMDGLIDIAELLLTTSKSIPQFGMQLLTNKEQVVNMLTRTFITVHPEWNYMELVEKGRAQYERDKEGPTRQEVTDKKGRSKGTQADKAKKDTTKYTTKRLPRCRR